MFCGGLCSRRSNFSDMLEWNAATKPVLLEAERGEPPASRAICPSCRYPLRYEQGSFLAGSAASARTGEQVDLTGPHFKCANQECGDVVEIEEGPGVVVDNEYDAYDEQSKTMEVGQIIRGRQYHHRSVQFTDGGKQAAKVLECAHAVADRIEAEDGDEFDKEWDAGDAFDGLRAEDVDTLLSSAEETLRQQPIVVEAQAPCKIFGDTHGQLRDLLLFFNTFGWPGDSKLHFVFNGDYVDRGAHQVEVALIVLALKVAHPSSVWLLRGNHEEESVNRKYGFDKACNLRFGDHGPRVFAKFHAAFNELPLACVVGGKILCVHGGIGDGHWTLDELKAKTRPITGDMLHRDDMLFNILWSDPIEDDDPKEHDTAGLHTSPRSKRAFKFGWNVTVDFCLLNGLDMVVRSHQYKKHGFGFDVMHDNMLVRVFTARDYEGKQDNDGAILSVTADKDEGILFVRPQVIRSISNE